MRTFIVNFILLLSSLLYAENLIDLYRFKGPEVISQYFEKQLTSKKFWLIQLENKDVKWGYFESNKDILVCIKSKKILKIFEKEKNSFKLIDSVNVLTGLDGDKVKEGDLRTPIGVYKLKTILKNVDDFYGPFAFVTGYPNLFDRINNKDGHGIWIHGVPINGKRDENSTKGCIVMDNHMLEKLKKEIDYKNTYLLISENTPLTATKDEIAEILAFIYKWRKAWRENNFNEYKNFYDDTFKKSDGTNLEQFLNYKKRVFANKKHQKVEIYFSDIDIVPYQNINNQKIFRINMFEKYISKTYKYTGPKELYVKFTSNGLKIIAEK
ncbi:L,D-transpeptidase family protein [Nautilia lithotrophica]